MKKKVNSLSCNVYTSHGEILKDFFFFFKYVTISIICKDSPDYLDNWQDSRLSITPMFHSD